LSPAHPEQREAGLRDEASFLASSRGKLTELERLEARKHALLIPGAVLAAVFYLNAVVHLLFA
jgi:hypothetical protein